MKAPTWLFAGVLILASMAAHVAYAAPFVTVPVQGVLTDDAGTAIDGNVSVEFNLWVDETMGASIWTETQTLPVEQGLFTAYLGAVEALDSELFVTYPTPHLTMAVDGDAAMGPWGLGHVPKAAYAERAGDAQTLGGEPASNFATTAEIQNLVGGPIDDVVIGDNTPVKGTFSPLRIRQAFNVTLTGTASVLAADDTLQGNGTVFLEELVPGDIVQLDSDVYQVLAVTADDEAQLASPAATDHISVPIGVGVDQLRVIDGNNKRQVTIDRRGALGVGVSKPKERVDVAGAVRAMNTPKVMLLFDGTNLDIKMGFGVASVTRVSAAGHYTITFETPFASADYVVLGSCNMLGTGGAVFGLEGHNDAGSSQYNFMTATSVNIGCRDTNNSNQDSKVVHVVIYGQQ